jgi:hypothetical protein
MSIAVTSQTLPASTIRVLLRKGEDPNGVSTLGDGVIMDPWVHFAFVHSPWKYGSLEKELLNDMLDLRFHSLLLSYHANPNNSKSGCSFTVFTMFLMTVFCPYDLLRRKTDDYLRTLDDFLATGARLDAAVRLEGDVYSRQYACHRWWPDRGDTSTVLRCLVRGLQSWKGSTADRLPNERFLSEVVKRILLNGKEHNYDIYGELITVVPSVFGEHLGTPLLTQIEYEAGRKASKRKREN